MYLLIHVLFSQLSVAEASFRGYPLQGLEVQLPEGYQGVVVEEIKKHLPEDLEKNASITKKFNSLTYWNWDCFPTKNDPYANISDWIDLSKVVTCISYFLMNILYPTTNILFQINED